MEQKYIEKPVPPLLSENFWIFVIKDTDDEFKRRVEDKSWPIHTYTSNRKKIQSGDKILFYKAGVGNKTILGAAEIVSEIKLKDGTADYTVPIDKIDVWEKPALMKPMVEKLDFIENNHQWGRYMQGGVIRISKNDYTNILSNN